MIINYIYCFRSILDHYNKGANKINKEATLSRRNYTKQYD